MKERPILFSTDMVLAILDGRKTMTRRVVKLPKWAKEDDVIVFIERQHGPDYYQIRPAIDTNNEKLWRSVECPYGQPGDLLWVRETWAKSWYFNGLHENWLPIYKADYNNGPVDWSWKPSIHMPRAAARIILKITDIRIERLQDITEQDAINEGINQYTLYASESAPHDMGDPPVKEFQKLWHSINGPSSWDSNPWVWVISFEST